MQDMEVIHVSLVGRALMTKWKCFKFILIDIETIYSSLYAFAAVTNDGNVITCRSDRFWIWFFKRFKEASQNSTLNNYVFDIFTASPQCLENKIYIICFWKRGVHITRKRFCWQLGVRTPLTVVLYDFICTISVIFGHNKQFIAKTEILSGCDFSSGKILFWS